MSANAPHRRARAMMADLQSGSSMPSLEKAERSSRFEATTSFTSPRRGEVGPQGRVRGLQLFRITLSPLTRSASPIDLSPPGRGEEEPGFGQMR